jgi:formylmethanofuran dehydrogenase subunit E
LEIKLKPIGIIHSPFKTIDQTPHWGTLTDAVGEIEIFPQYEEGLDKIEKYSSIEVLFYFHQSRRDILRVTPPHDKEERGVFATRAPVRPNPIGLTHMEILERKGRFLKVKNIDMVDGTPVLDIKPHT